MENSGMPVDATPEMPGEQFDGEGAGIGGAVQIFTDPQGLGEKIRNKANIALPWIVLFLIAFVAMYLIAEPMLDAALATPEGRERWNEQLDQARGMSEEMMRTVSIWSTAAVAPIFMTVVSPLLAAAIMLFIGNFVLAGEVKYKKLLAVALFATFITTVGQLLYSLGALATGNAFFAISLGFLAPHQAQGDPIFQLLSLIDLFFIWQIIAAGIALATVYNFPRNKGYLISVITFGGLGLIGVTLAALFS